MILTLDMNNATPIYLQLRNQIVMGIGQGQLKIGQGLPTVRQMAEDLCVNAMTVNKAYSLLKSEGYIEIDHRHGAKVSECVNLNSVFKEKVESELTLLIAESSIKGLSKEDFISICGTLFAKINISYAKESV